MPLRHDRWGRRDTVTPEDRARWLEEAAIARARKAHIERVVPEDPFYRIVDNEFTDNSKNEYLVALEEMDHGPESPGTREWSYILSLGKLATKDVRQIVKMVTIGSGSYIIAGKLTNNPMIAMYASALFMMKSAYKKR